ncbi:DEAD/DEAH box helicase family protein [Pontibacillus sp. HMF3514]|uniref:DEAD/DEAH box helicase family protein n=1 Tax=Pontibacillus sp. HMF3514 TaxID=2692425 RepID=UPI0013201CA5|nr:DEAD/DEAH box helicase family protein [Pontibacillus sp. HMF3514]QHE51673.1 DEAD/DEAH box helicase family protein [Pontibacillus sp. HMF3514]
MTDTKLITQDLQNEIIYHIQHSSTIYLLSAFVMKSGVSMMLPALQEAAHRGADIKILAGDYLFVSQPEAMELLTELPNDQVEVRLWQSNGRSFHPKAFLFKQEDEGSLIVGSSNLSRSALTSGVEWNLFLNKSVSEETYQDSLDQFIHLFYEFNTMEINKETVKQYKVRYDAFHVKHPDLARKWTKSEEIEMTLGPENESIKLVKSEEETYTTNRDKPEPRFAQPEALDSLHNTVEEGYDKAMVVMATGLGKTYLAAFFAEHFDSVLFIAHREEILHQAKASFEHVNQGKSGGIFNGKVKDGDHPMVFASIFTLSIRDHLSNFNPDSFDLIIIDEFHHASSKSYQNVIQYFQPKFLMGITATPERTDGQDVFAICDGNVAYEMNFIQAIQRGWLAPFQYYGVYDEIDYAQITWLGNKYDEEELAEAQLQESTAENILDNWKKHKQTRTLVFCSSIKQATFLSEYFNEQGYQTISLHSKTKDISRKEAIQKLETKQIDAIFTVDVFNEGVDIPAVDTILFVRPTESLVVFTQQIGRGLRKHLEKNHCTIIDLIGNYRNADVKLRLFDTSDQERKGKKEFEPITPDGCTVHLDPKAIDLLEHLRKKRSPRKERVKMDFEEVKNHLGRRPTYLEMHLNGTVNSKEIKNNFKSYAGFLAWAEELSEEEKRVYLDYKNWLEEVESTGMSKSYKMVVLKYMLERGPREWYKPVTPTEVAPYFHRFLMEKPYRKLADFNDKDSRKLWEYDENKVARLIARMPMTKWSGSSKELVLFDGETFSLAFNIAPEDTLMLYEMTNEICEYRLHWHFERKSK